MVPMISQVLLRSYELNLRNRVNAPKAKSTSHSIGLSSGITFFVPAYGSSGPIAGSSERGIASYFGQIDYTYAFNNKYFFRTGLLYENLVYEFGWTGTVQEDYFIPNALVEIRNSVVSGNAHHTYSDTTVTAASTRTILDYNEFKQMNLPLLVGRKFALAKLDLDLGLGPTVTFYSYSKGKIFQDDIIEYDGTDNAVYNSNLKIALMTQSRITYNFNKSIGLFADLAYRKYLTDWAKSEDIIFKPQVLNGGLGLTYQFGAK